MCGVEGKPGVSVVRVHLHVNKKFCGRSIWHAGVQSDSDNLGILYEIIKSRHPEGADNRDGEEVGIVVEPKDQIFTSPSSTVCSKVE
jgi:hypothetical protein